MRNLRYPLVLAAVLLGACPRSGTTGVTHPGGGDGTGPGAIEVPDQVGEDSYLELVRRLRSAAEGASGRSELRTLLVGHLSERQNVALEERRFDRSWAYFADAMSLYEPGELRPGGLDPRIAGMARHVLDVYEPRGDEARVLAALLVLTLAEPDNAEHAARYREVSQWSEEAREALPSEAERVLGLIDIFERVTSVAPLDDPVDRLSHLYLQRSGLLRTTFGGPGGLGALLSPRRSSELQSLLASRGRTVTDLVALYLRAGRAAEVRRVSAALGPLPTADRDLVRATRDLTSDRRGARARAFLAAALGRDRPVVALRLCHEGRRVYPRDGTFCICLAELYRSIGDSDGALEYYEANLDNDPSVESFEVALRYVAMELEVQLADEDPRRARETFERAERILAAFDERHEGREPPIRQDQLSYLVGMGEFNAGNIEAAVERLEASLEARPSRPALLQLGIIAERQGRTEDAIRRYRQALDLREGSQENPLSRAGVLGHLAEAYGLAGEQARSEALYGEALLMLQSAMREMPAEAMPVIRIERSIILHQLGRGEEAIEELRQALASAPARQATYGRLLSFYIGRGMVGEAEEVYRRAFNLSDLGRMWKVYFSMWIVGLQRRLGRDPEPTATRFLESVEGDEWIERLGRYYAGGLSYEDLLEGAETRGQQAEAYYYEAVLRLAGGERAEATALLRQVVETNMMGYYEYDFARRLTTELAAAPPAAESASTAPAE